MQRAGERRGHGCKLHVASGDEALIPTTWMDARATVRRAEGDREEPQVELLEAADLSREWEWEDTPEVSLKIVDSLDEAISLFNRHSPRFSASLISDDTSAHTGSTPASRRPSWATA